MLEEPRDDKAIQPEQRTGLSLAAIFLGDSFDSSAVKSITRGMMNLASRLSVVTSDPRLGAEDLGIASARLLHFDCHDAGSRELELALKAAFADDEHEKYLVFLDGTTKFPPPSQIAAWIRKRVDFLEHASCLVLSDRYARHVASTGERPSLENASKNGYSIPLSIPEMIRSPRQALAQNPVVFKFMAVGLSGVLVNLAVGIVLKIWIPKLFANATAVELSILSNFYFNDVITFRPRHPTDIRVGRFARFFRFVKYNIVSLGGLALNEAVFYILSSRGVSYVPSSLVAIAVAFVLNYFGSSRWAWRGVLDSQSHQ
jgi:putative flippase GtrA